MQDAYEMTLGMWVDYIIEYNNMQYRADHKGEDPENRTVNRRATQSDFDSF